MALLKVSAADSPFDGKEVTLPADGTFVIGREAGSGLVLPHTEVSRRHAEIYCAPGDYQLANLSKLGTSVGGGKIKDVHNLKNGDAIRIGAATLTFVETTAAPANGAEKNPRPAAAKNVSAPAPKNSDFAVPERLVTRFTCYFPRD